MQEEGDDSGVGIVKLRDNVAVAVCVSDASYSGGVSLYWPPSLLESNFVSSRSCFGEAPPTPPPLKLLLLLPVLLLLGLLPIYKGF